MCGSIEIQFTLPLSLYIEELKMHLSLNISIHKKLTISLHIQRECFNIYNKKILIKTKTFCLNCIY